MRILALVLVFPVLFMLFSCKEEERTEPIEDKYAAMRDRMVK